MLCHLQTFPAKNCNRLLQNAARKYVTDLVLYIVNYIIKSAKSGFSIQQEYAKETFEMSSNALYTDPSSLAPYQKRRCGHCLLRMTFGLGFFFGGGGVKKNHVFLIRTTTTNCPTRSEMGLTESFRLECKHQTVKVDNIPFESMLK